MKHTPGPWVVFDPTEHGLEAGLYTYGIDSTSGESIILYGDSEDREGIRSLADARLIAAAPKLYEAAWSALDALNCGATSSDDAIKLLREALKDTE
jgi:hypothetical protein